jgi:hypothetical protein
MQSYNSVKNSLNNTFWTSDYPNAKNKLIQLIFPVGLTLNDKFAYMGYALLLDPTPYYYYPQTNFFDVQIGIDGKLYIPLTNSMNISNDEIRFSNGVVWKRVSNIPANTSVDYLEVNEVRKRSIQESEYLFNKMYPIYGTHPIVPGQKVPQ